MTEKEKELKSFNQCADALNSLEKKSILKVFHMLSIHFEIVDNLVSVPTKDNFDNSNYEESFVEKPKLIEAKMNQKRKLQKRIVQFLKK